MMMMKTHSTSKVQAYECDLGDLGAPQQGQGAVGVRVESHSESPAGRLGSGRGASPLPAGSSLGRASSPRSATNTATLLSSEQRQHIHSLLDEIDVNGDGV